jgi:hypothetical protein
MSETTPPGWTVIEEKLKDCYGSCLFGEKTIQTIPVHDVFSLGVYLHEVAHANLHDNKTADDREHVTEYQAERTAIRTLKYYKIAIPPVLIFYAKLNVARWVGLELAQGISIEPHIRRWAWS